MHKNLDDFLANLEEQLKLAKIELKPDWVIDHICYRCDTEALYTGLKERFSSEGKLLIESTVGGRLIATYKLNTPLEILGQKVDVLELPAPKAGKNTPEGYEHIEIVCSETFEELENLFSHLKLDKKGMTKTINPELEVEFDGCAIKFHHQTLESVIEYEKTLC